MKTDDLVSMLANGEVAVSRRRASSRIWLAVLIFFIYYNLATTGKTWIARGTVPEVVGLWWTHVVVALLALAVIVVPGLIHRLRYRLRYGTRGP